MGTLWQDVRYGLRMLGRSPGFTTVAVLTLALGIGANTAIFTLVNALLLKALPVVKDPQSLVLVTENGRPYVSYPLYEHLRDGGTSLSGLFVSGGIDQCRMTVAGMPGVEAEPVWAQPVSGEFFSVLGVPAALGRTLTPNDDRQGAPQAVAVISYDLWRRRFGLDPAAVGRTVTLGDTALTIVGVAPCGFFGFVADRRPDLWWPIQMGSQVAGWTDELTQSGAQWLQIAGRLKPGTTRSQARDELDVLFHRMRLAEAEETGLSGNRRQEYVNHRIELRPAAAGFTGLRGEMQQLLFILMVIVSIVLLVACTNLAGLLLARGAARGRELGLRVALGAGRLTLMRQLMTENLLLAGLGAALGLLLAQWGVRLLVQYIPGYGQTVVLRLTPDVRILTFTVLMSLGTGVVFGLLPAWSACRQAAAAVLKDAAGNIVGRRSGQFWNKALLVGQIALSCCLVIGAGLFVRTARSLRTLDVGFDRESLLVFRLDMDKGYRDDARRADLHAEVLRRVQDLAGVRCASMSSLQSLGASENGYGPTKLVVATSTMPVDEGMDVRGTAVAPGYFQTMGIPLLLGRDFGPRDEWIAPADRVGQPARPVIIDQTSARRLFGEDNPLGRLLRGGGRGVTWPPLEVIGVVGDVIHKELRGGTRISLYSLETCRCPAMEFVHVRTMGDPLAVADGIRRVVHELDAHVDVAGLYTEDDLVNGQLRRERMLAQLASFFSLCALALACIGLYGILSYGVARRTREIGIRMALGAQKRSVLTGIIGQGMALTLMGSGLGVILAYGLTRLVSTLLYGVTPTDPVTFVLTVLILALVALVSCWVPARRAARIDPMAALRYE